MIRPGLVSITFRRLVPREIVALCRECGLEGIEWGGDIHVPHGDLAAAREVAEMTRDAGQTVAAYGSYYRAAADDPDLPFSKVLETAAALGAPRIRVWAGRGGSENATPDFRAAVAADLARCAAQAAEAGIVVALEFHAATLTDTAASAAQLMTDLEGSGVRLYWQPPVGLTPETTCQGLEQVLPWVDDVHVYSWKKEESGLLRLPLAEGAAVWESYLSTLRRTDAKRWALLEFVRDDDPANLAADAKTLRGWLRPET